MNKLRTEEVDELESSVAALETSLSTLTSVADEAMAEMLALVEVARTVPKIHARLAPRIRAVTAHWALRMASVADHIAQQDGSTTQ